MVVSQLFHNQAIYCLQFQGGTERYSIIIHMFYISGGMTMKKKLVAAILGLTMTAAVAGGTAFTYAENSDSQIELAIAGDDANTESSSDINYSGVETVSMTEEADNDDSDKFSYSSVADVAEADMPAIVAITTSTVQEVQDWFSRQTYQREYQGAGSGIIIGSNDDELLIATNNHVVEGATTLTVTFIDESNVEAVIKGTDPDNDLAVVAVKLEDIDKDTKSQIKIAKAAEEDELRVGEQVVAIGNALGYGQSVTTGIVSALDRTIQAGESGSYDVSTYEDLIQTDAAINPGNSGGALLNMEGEVIGINSAKASESGVEGMGYAIPISKAMPILEDLMSRETRTKVDEDKVGYMGIAGDGVSSEATQLYNVPAGVYVTQVGEDTPAEEAGLQQGDIITTFDGQKVTSMQELQQDLQYYAAGEEVDLTVERASGNAYEEQTITITLGEKPTSNQQ